MDAATYLDRASRLPVRDLDAFGPGGVVVVAPHPDDESLGCGGTLAACAAAGRPVAVVVVSDGGGSHPGSRTHPRSRLVRLRETETRSALAKLGIAPACAHFLRLADEFVPRHGPDSYRASRAVADIADGIGATAVCVTWQHDPHADHQASFAIAARANLMRPARFLTYPVWGWTLPAATEVEPVAPEGFRIDVRLHAHTKRAAIAAHGSQLGGVIRDDPTAFELSPAMLAHVCGPFEVFIEAGA